MMNDPAPGDRRDVLRETPRRARRTIERHGLIRSGERVIAAVSGGADSIALLQLLSGLSAELGFAVRVVHVNHGLRGRAAQADARFVERRAAALGLPCRVVSLALKRVAPRDKRDASPESEWRAARYDALVREARRWRADCIALGHHRDDLAETVLMRLIRGAGARGLAAFGPLGQRDGVRLVRPLYELSRREIEEYCRAAGLAWREDASNRDRRRLRNRIRLELLPLIEREFNPSVRAGLARTAETLREDEALLDALARAQWRAMGGGGRRVPRSLPLEELRALPVALLRRVLRLWLEAISASAYPPLFSEVARLAELIVEAHAGARFELRRRWAFARERERVVVRTMTGTGTSTNKRTRRRDA